MFFNRKKKLELEIAEAKAREAEAKAQEAKAVKDAEYYKMAAAQKLEEFLSDELDFREIEEPYIPKGVIPEGKPNALAMDSACSAGAYAIARENTQFFPLFEGFPKLSFLVQSSDYYSVVETTANEMTREWGEFKVVDGGDNKEDQRERVKKLNEAFDRFNVKDLFNHHIRNELTFGRSQLFLDIAGQDDKLNLPLVVNSNTIPKGSLKGLTVIDPIWSTPSDYNSIDPTKSDFFKPARWYVLGKEIHSDRLLTMVTRPVPDMFKPAYNFSGLSMVQLMQPYVERWQRSVDSASDLLDSFSTSGIKTEMGDILSGTASDPSQLLTRIMMWTKMRNNRGAMVLDKEKEDFFQVNTPLGGVPELMRHLQEQMGAPSHTPLVKLLGITPSGLNASSEGEIRVYYDHISALQEFTLLRHVEHIGKVMQLHLFGDVDESISFVFKPLYQLSEKEISEKVLSDVQSLQLLLQEQVITPEEARQAIAKVESWLLGFVDPEDVPEYRDMMELDYGEENKDFERYQAERGNPELVQETA